MNFPEEFTDGNLPDYRTENEQERMYREQCNREKIDEETQYVPVGHTGVATAEDEKPYIGTRSLTSCVGIAIYDHENKVGGVAHVFFKQKISTPSGEYVNDPEWFQAFHSLAQRLIQEADQRGGRHYKLTLFNVRHCVRATNEIEQLLEFVDQTTKQLSQAGKIATTEYRDEDAFRLDTRNGNIVPYY